jgi:hypothetical protein
VSIKLGSDVNELRIDRRRPEGALRRTYQSERLDLTRLWGAYDQTLPDVRVRLNCLDRHRFSGRVIDRTCEIVAPDKKKRGIKRKLRQHIFSICRVLRPDLPKLPTQTEVASFSDKIRSSTRGQLCCSATKRLSVVLPPNAAIRSAAFPIGRPR